VIDDDVFRAHLESIRACGARGVTLGEALEPSADCRVAITFDDGCASDLDLAAPALAGVGFGATFFVTVDWIDTPGFLTAGAVRELARLGFEIGSHSLSHAYLAGLHPDRLTQEIAESRDRLEQIAGTAVRHFSCPGGRWDANVARVAREAGYTAVADSTPVPWRQGGDPLRIGRYAITERTSAEDIRRLIEDGAWARSVVKSFFLQTAKTVLGDRLYDRARRILLERGA
jgi:peptidoglycan/xylan/chitin deacetylase (PgdA/CDA1 family)